MQLFSRSALVVSVAVGLLAAMGLRCVGAGSAAKANAPPVIASGDGVGGFWQAAPNLGLEFALGGLGTVAALAGGTAMVRQRLSAQAAALDAEVNPGTAAETETVLVAMPGEIESEVALAYRR